MKSKEKNKFTMEKDDFIDFLSSATPVEVSNLIANKGKPMKLNKGTIFFDKDNDNKKGDKA